MYGEKAVVRILASSGGPLVVTLDRMLMSKNVLVPFRRLITDEIRQLISDGRPAQEIERAAAKVGYRSLRYYGLKKVLLGLTTIEEVEQNRSFEWAT